MRQLAPAAALALLLAACGGGGSDTPVPPPPPPPPPPKFNCAADRPTPAPTARGSLSVAPPASEFNLLAAPPTTVQFARYDLRSGMSYSYGFAVADFDCDARQDISFFDSYTPGRDAFRVGTGAIGYLQWNGGPQETIVASDSFPDLPASANGTVLFERHIAMDVDGDGRLDIVGVVNSHGTVAAYLNPGYRGQAWQRVTLSTRLPGALNIASGDLDGDGRLDIIVSMRQQPSTDPDPATKGVAWLRNPGGAGLAWVQSSIDGTSDLIDPRTLVVADFDKDGRMDVAVSDNGTGQLTWFGKSSGESTWRRHLIPGVLTVHGHFGIAVDLDNDGQVDILQPSYQGIVWLRNLDGGQNWQATPIANFALENRQLIVTELAVGDLDLDDHSDIVFVVSSLSSLPAEARRGGVYWLRQSPSAWELNEILRADSATVGVSLLDYDGDGDVDIVSNNEYQSNSVTVWLNDKI